MNEYIMMITFSSLLTDLNPASSAGDRARLPSKASAGDLSSLSYKNTQKYKDTNSNTNTNSENTNTNTKR